MNKQKNIILVSFLIACIAETFLFYLTYFNPYKIEALYAADSQLTMNALFNALSALSSIIAVVFVLKKRIFAHKIFIHLALIFSSCFLLNYILYHMSTGNTVFTNTTYRPYYLVILITHLTTSTISLPMIFISYALGVFGHLSSHKKLARITFYLWQYVTWSGVIIVLFLKFLN